MWIEANKRLLSKNCKTMRLIMYGQQCGSLINPIISKINHSFRWYEMKSTRFCRRFPRGWDDRWVFLFSGSPPRGLMVRTIFRRLSCQLLQVQVRIQVRTWTWRNWQDSRGNIVLTMSPRGGKPENMKSTNVALTVRRCQHLYDKLVFWW
jgi:hypothetical protein